MMKNPSNKSGLVQVGVVVSAHGVKGGVKIKSFTADPLDLTAYGPLTDSMGKKNYSVVVTGERSGTLLASIKDVTTREAAEALRGTALFVSRNALPETKEDEFYHEDLIGLSVQLQDGSAYGDVYAVHDYGAGPLLEIEHAGGRELFAFTDATFPTVNLDEGTLTMIPPEIIEAKEE